MKCVNCKRCISTMEIEGKRYYLCSIGDGIECVEECIANDDEMLCTAYIDEFEEVYDKNCNDDFTARS